MTKTRREIVYLGGDKVPVREFGGRAPVALVFPQKPSLGLSTLGWQVVYQGLSASPDTGVERFFLQDDGSPPRSHDSGRPLTEFAVIAVSLNFEEDIADFARMLIDAGIEPRAKKRGRGPLILAGGPLVFLNPAPILPCADMVFVGEFERFPSEMFGLFRQYAVEGMNRRAVLEKAARMPGLLVPGVSELPVRRVLDASGTALPGPGYSSFVSPEAEFRDMFLIEINRGCPYGCRFCAAGFIYRPPRQADLPVLKDLVERVSPRKVGLVGTALTDWPDLLEFLQWLNGRGIKFSLSSVRADGLTEDLVGFLRKTGVRTLTLALEAPSRRLRLAANKGVSDRALLNAVEMLARHRYNHLKLYLIVGWPGETDEDYVELDGFLDRIEEAADRGRGKRARGLEYVTLSVSCLVPKPFTPLQWAPMAGEEHLKQAMARIKKMVAARRGMRFSGENPFRARLQGLIARGDERVFDLALSAARHGGAWKKALKQWPVDPGEFLDRKRGRDEVFAWEIVDVGVDREYLRREWEKYKQGTLTPPCPAEGCGVCGRCGAADLVRE